MTRRLVTMLLLVGLLAVSGLPTGVGSADEQRPADQPAGEWAAEAGVQAYSAADDYRFQAAFPVNALMVHWARAGAPDAVMVEVGTSADGQRWSAWQAAPVDEDADGRFVADRRYTGAVMVPPARYVRVRTVDPLGQTVALTDLRVTYLNTLAGPESDSLEAQAKKKATPTPTVTPAPTAVPTAPAAGGRAVAAAADVNVIPRAAWGANENLRFRDGKESWPREYRLPEKVVLHHTETPNGQDPMAALRAVYYFHTVTKGWGDIGYNYLIDMSGRIYEGRAGGLNVIAGHTLGYNSGTLGIAFLGSFQQSSISPQAEAAAASLIASRARSIDPLGQGFFNDKTLPNIGGHRDFLATSCPGNAFYPRLPAVRDQVLQRIGYRPALDAKITDVQIGPASLTTSDKLTVKVTVTNTGSAVLPGDLQGAGLTYVEGQDYTTRGLPKVTGRFRVALEAAGSADRYPYRWGLGRALLPGEAATITGAVQLTSPRQRTFTVALVQEYVRYWQQDVAPTTVTVVGPPITVPDPAPVPELPVAPRGPLPSDPRPPPGAPDPTRIYFPETGHFLAYSFRAYWEQNGGLAQFGYPITEEFREVNPADGQEYTVQYFERARFEYHPEYQGTPYEVLLGLLGNQVTAGRGFAVSPPTSQPPAAGARYFPETQQWVSGPILKAWTERGGLMTYGYPISPEMDERNPDDGKIYRVQYFERNRLEYHPEFKGTPHEVLLGLLGRQVLVDRGWLAR